ncbi:MAG: ribose ABC transporter substrate-binding protein, partial [Verrucomicrobia bacterium]|nr:ribose ABC transporter substrate-binding protein [Verrucomicrobiota bacterium]
MKTLLLTAIVPLALLTQTVSITRAADTYEPDCFKPYKPDTKTLQYPAKKPPYRVALANGFVGNTWRIEMIKCLQAYAEDPEIKP